LTVATIAPERAHRLRTRATYAALAVALVLIAVKVAAWLGSGSVALLSSLVDSLVDAAASVVNVIAVKHAMSPADREHRFGHGKAEPLAALGQSAFLIGSALLLLAEAARRMISPTPVENGLAAIAVMVFATIVAAGLVAYQRHVVGLTRSLAIGADEIHYRGDVILNLAVIAAIVSSGWLRLPILDPIFGAGAGIWIVWRAIGIVRLSITQLMDQELPDEERARIRGIAERHPGVSAVHDMRTRVAGPTAFIQLHLEMDGAMNLLRAHEIADGVEAELRRAYPGAEIIIHQDPAGLEEPPEFPSRVAAS
jgi:ferrous-iron efflux pump FieF